MQGTLNGVHLNSITSITTELAGNSTLTTIRGIEPSIVHLESLKLNSPARLILSDNQIEGVLIAFAKHGQSFRITIESLADGVS
jgi:hypothetical protein